MNTVAKKTAELYATRLSFAQLKSIKTKHSKDVTILSVVAMAERIKLDGSNRNTIHRL